MSNLVMRLARNQCVCSFVSIVFGLFYNVVVFLLEDLLNYQVFLGMWSLF
jgi:hypothetical protein